MAKAEEYIKGDHYLFKNSVLAIDKITPEKYLLRFEKQFDLKAGHVVAVAINKNHTPRIYSVCSGENDNYMQIFFNLKEDGVFTPLLTNLSPGVLIFVSKPYSSFLLDNDTPMICIATETGISPFYAMLKSGYKANLYYTVLVKNRISISSVSSKTY